MSDDGTSFSIDLGVEGGTEATSAADALAALSDRLTLAGTAAVKAAEAVKSGEAAYGQAEISAGRAAKAVESIGAKADEQRGKLKAAMDVGDDSAAEKAAARLRNLLDRQEELSTKSEAAKVSLREQAAALDVLKSAAATAAETEAELAAQMEDQESQAEAAASSITEVSDAADEGSGNMRALSGAFSKLGGPLGEIGSKAAGFAGGLQRMSQSVGAVGPYLAMAVVVVALTAAVVAGTYAMLKFGIASADAARTAQLLDAGIAGSVEGGKQLDAAISAVGDKVPLTRDELQGMAGDLAKSGLKGDALASALDKAAVKAATLKFGPDFAKQMLGLDFQAQKLKENISGPKGIFSGLNVDGLEAGIQTIVALFSSTSASGQAMKAVFESICKPLIDGLTALIPKAVATFIQFEILALKAMIAIKPFGSTIVKIGEAFLVAAAVVVGAAALVIGIFVALAAVPFLVLAALEYLGQAAFKFGESLRAPIQSAVQSVHAAFDGLVAKVQSIIAYLQGTSLAQIGSDMIQGLVDGITGAGAKVLGAITGIVGGAVDAAKNLLGIHSPSTVFASIGVNTGEGMAQGVDRSSGGVQDSLEAMVAPPDTAPAAAAVAGGKGPSASSGAGLNLSGATFQFYGVEGAEDAESRFAGLLTRLLEGDAASLGVAVPA